MCRSLSDNQLTGPIPPEVGQMTGLTDLCVHGCASARLLLLPPSARAHLAPLHLRALTLTLSVDRPSAGLRRYVDGNQLNGTIPTELSLMTALQQLCVHGCASARLPLPPPSPRAHLAPLCLCALHRTLSDDALATAALRRYLMNNQLVGPIPPEVGPTGLLELCVHGCASARLLLLPPSARAHLAPLHLVLSISRSPLTRSLRGDAQDRGRQPAQRHDPN